jgi:hypothetical protein
LRPLLVSDSGLARRWVQSRPGGRWGPGDWLALVDELRRSPFWPMDLNALRRLVEGLRPSPARAAQRPAPFPPHAALAGTGAVAPAALR